MKTRLLRYGLVLSGLASAMTAHASNVITMSGAVFHARPGDEHASGGNGSVSNGGYGGTYITFEAEIPHLYVYGGSPTGYTVYMDGYGGNTSIGCSVIVRDYLGNYLANISLSTPATSGSWEISTSLTASQVPGWAYMTASCIMPGSDRDANRAFLNGLAVVGG